ncbi:hypothetical protein HanPI659440_Chr17g0689791 [Helianthus annuus]|nr:hypothetical protein HanPI659440_Chr17g0689791 [Helianthus annuus]
MDSEIYIALKKFDNFTGIKGESIEELIKRYVKLYLEMERLKITKTNEEWVDKLANVLPGDMWRTYLLDLKKIYLNLNLSLFIEKIEERELKRLVMQKLMKQNSNLRKLFRKKSRLKTFQLSRLRRKLRM